MSHRAWRSAQRVVSANNCWVTLGARAARPPGPERASCPRSRLDPGRIRANKMFRHPRMRQQGLPPAQDCYIIACSLYHKAFRADGRFITCFAIVWLLTRLRRSLSSREGWRAVGPLQTRLLPARGGSAMGVSPGCLATAGGNGICREASPPRTPPPRKFCY